MAEFQKRFYVFLTDVDPDTGEVSQLKVVAYTETEGYAKVISEFLNKDDEDPNRTYSYNQIK